MRPLDSFKNYKSKSYLHIDNKKSIKHVYKQIQDKEYVSKHAFLPFIHYSLDLGKYTFKPGESNKTLKKKRLNKNFNQSEIKDWKPKKREINYASHMDSFIYKYYGELLNEQYNSFAIANGIDECAIAYRDNKKGQSNIHFAKEVFKFIIEQEDVFIIALDFSSFFDKISHVELKQTLKQILDVKELPSDIYNVFKSITKFRYVEKQDLDEYLKKKYPLDDVEKFIKEHKINSYMDVKEFRKLVKERKINVYPKKKNNIGIPQGSGMSAICSNVRLINFDIEMNNWTKSLNGLYRRYCDDLIWVIPKDENMNINNLEEEIYGKISKYQDLHLQKEKTIVLSYSKGEMKDTNKEDSKLDYLGFVFDGQVIKTREKSLFKYYNRAYRKTKVLAKKHIIFQRNAYMRNLYGLYTHLGRNYKGHGNFVTYAYKAQSIMEELPVDVQVRKQVKRHWHKVHARLEKSKQQIVEKIIGKVQI
ncbi:reverse transcriptase [Lysinibacillus sp. OTC-L20]|uniref:reverse transcriptase n=1 Tax=Lysinibacillus sp. OTC-L20 TaxID=3342791 RepID=UPI0035BA0FB6